MPTLTMTKGLPASGKTTYAKKQSAKRVNKDDLRKMIDDGRWSKENEKFILLIRDVIIAATLAAGRDIIVDDTNLAPKHESDLHNYCIENGYDFEIKDFTDVPLSTCLKRDSERANSVGEKVIKTMYNTFLKPNKHVAQYQPVPVSEDLPWCIVVDIDGTLAHMTDRSPYDYTKVSTDVVDPIVAGIVRKYAQRDPNTDFPDNYIIIVSGRMGPICEAETRQWLQDNHIPYDELYMRQVDQIPDTDVKKEIYDKYIKPRYNVRFVLDDRDRVVKMWRELGLKVLQVGEGDF